MAESSEPCRWQEVLNPIRPGSGQASSELRYRSVPITPADAATTRRSQLILRQSCVHPRIRLSFVSITNTSNRPCPRGQGLFVSIKCPAGSIGGVARGVACQPLLARLRELFSLRVVVGRVDPLPAAQVGNGRFPAELLQHDPDPPLVCPRGAAPCGRSA